MAKIEKGKMVLSDDERALVEEGKEFDLIPNQKGIYLLIDKELEKEKEGTQVCIDVPSPLQEAKERVVGRVNKANLSELVEGKFEESLSKEEKDALKELLKEGRIFVFKLNESYKKGVYRVKKEPAEEKKGEEKKGKKKKASEFYGKEKAPEKHTLKEDGIVVVKSEGLVKKISSEKEKEIKEGKLKGLKSFDGKYYIVEAELLNRYWEKALEQFRKREKMQLEELAKSLGISKMLTKTICEFLKDEGEIIERRKGEYAYIN